MQYVQKAYFTNMQSLNEMGNQFSNNSTNLLVLHSRDLANPAVVETKIGEEHYDGYVKGCIIDVAKPIAHPIKCNNFLSSVDLQLYIASQVRDGDLDKVFEEHEDQEYPPALSQFAVIVHVLQPVSAKTFCDHVMHVYLPYIESQLLKAFRVDVVIKAGTRQGKGKGVRKHLEATSVISRNWQEFL
ncbi:hypothetical protein Hamer_G014922, partial [Homarus americanus]